MHVARLATGSNERSLPGDNTPSKRMKWKQEVERCEDNIKISYSSTMRVIAS
jgi:hypothetical protein